MATKGKALFRYPEERDNVQMRDEFLNRHRLSYEHPLIFDLVNRMTHPSPTERIRIRNAVSHPAAWDSAFVCTFLRALANAFNRRQAKDLQSEIDKNAALILPDEPDWTRKMPERWMTQINLEHRRRQEQQEAAERGQQKGAKRYADFKLKDKWQTLPTELISHLRNLYEHSRESKIDAAFEEISMQESFVNTVVFCFPRLLPVLFDIFHQRHGSVDWSPQSGFSLHILTDRLSTTRSL